VSKSQHVLPLLTTGPGRWTHYTAPGNFTKAVADPCPFTPRAENRAAETAARRAVAEAILNGDLTPQTICLRGIDDTHDVNRGPGTVRSQKRLCHARITKSRGAASEPLIAMMKAKHRLAQPDLHNKSAHCHSLWSGSHLGPSARPAFE